MLRNGASVLLVDLERSHLHIDERGLDIGMTHQLHECWQTDAGPYHVGGERVPEAVRISQFDASSPVSIFLDRVLTQVRCKLIEDFEKGAERGDLNALRVGRIDLGMLRVAGCTNSSRGEQVNLH
jgi:hypothetical protein